MYIYISIYSTSLIIAYTEVNKLDIVPALIIYSQIEKIDCELVLHTVPLTYIFNASSFMKPLTLSPIQKKRSLLELCFKSNTFFSVMFLFHILK